jgi:hypothetical protein
MCVHLTGPIALAVWNDKSVCGFGSFSGNRETTALSHHGLASLESLVHQEAQQYKCAKRIPQ